MSETPHRGPDDVSLLWMLLVRFAAERIVRPSFQPSLEDFQRVARCQSTDGREVVAAVTGADSAAVAAPYLEARTVFQELPNRRVEGSAYRTDWRMELDHAAVLFAIVRLFKPASMVETGIADGFSSLAILSAMAANGSGRLISVDVRSGTGALVPAELRASWQPVILDPRESIRGLSEILQRERTIDLFLHDSRHTYGHMLREYAAAWPHLRPGGLLMSDDADSTFAFLDFARHVNLPVTAHVGSRKVFGLISKPGASRANGPG
jgi:predicted O-methyltransferase YrrM